MRRRIIFQIKKNIINIDWCWLYYWTKIIVIAFWNNEDGITCIGSDGLEYKIMSFASLLDWLAVAKIPSSNQNLKIHEPWINWQSILLFGKKKLAINKEMIRWLIINNMSHFSMNLLTPLIDIKSLTCQLESSWLNETFNLYLGKLFGY